MRKAIVNVDNKPSFESCVEWFPKWDAIRTFFMNLREDMVLPGFEY